MKHEGSEIADLHVFGPKTQYSVVHADPDEKRDWLRTGPACEPLRQKDIAHVGVMHAHTPFDVRRSMQSGTYMMACLAGEGVVLADGKWVTIKAGQACLLPPFCQNALKCVPGKPWVFAWVRYLESKDQSPIVAAHSPVSGTFDGNPLKHAILGLKAECDAASGVAAMHQWIELIHHYVSQFAQPHTPDSRLWKVWQEVENDLQRKWTLVELAKVACVSPEHLRRICTKEIGRSPMRQLTFLRLKRAADLLVSTQEKVETISREVGFESTHTFSNTFKKWFGWRPSEYRE